MSKRESLYRQKRVSTRVTLAEWRFLEKVASLTGYATVSDLLRDIMRRFCSETMTRISERSRRDSIGAEIAGMFRNYEEGSGEWGPDINKRK